MEADSTTLVSEIVNASVKKKRKRNVNVYLLILHDFLFHMITDEREV